MRFRQAGGAAIPCMALELATRKAGTVEVYSGLLLSASLTEFLRAQTGCCAEIWPGSKGAGPMFTWAGVA